ncbi:MAG: hypothetical protein WCV80_01775 [Candidatus Paceibacterota bacterium]|jgi:hypothetical protein
MAKKLLSLLREIEWKSVVKIALVVALLVFLWVENSSWWSIIFFLVGFSFIYFSESHERESFVASSWLLALLSILGIRFAVQNDISFYVPILIVIVFTTLLSVLLGLLRFFFHDRVAVYGVVNTVLLFGFFLHFFIFPLSWTLLFFTAIGVFLLLREFFLFAQIPWQGRVFLGSIVASFLSLELAFLVRFLPLGFINAALFLCLFLVLLRDAIKAHFEGSFNLSFALRSSVILLFGTALIFAASPWGI